MVAAAIWLVGSVLAHSSRAQFIDQATLSATVAGFIIAFRGLVFAAEQLRATVSPADIAMALRTPDVWISRSSYERSPRGSNMLIIVLTNGGPAPLRVTRVDLEPSVIHLEERGSWSSREGFIVGPGYVSEFAGGHGTQWAVETAEFGARHLWLTDEFSIPPNGVHALPPLTVEMDDPAAAKAMVSEGCQVRLPVWVYSDRGRVTSVLHAQFREIDQ